MDNKVRKQIEEYVKSLRWTPKDFYWKHAFQVRDLALIIQERIGGDKDIVEASALLHDVGKSKLLAHKHEEMSAIFAKEFLERIGFDKNKIKKIIDCIKYKNSDLIEERVLRSADSMGLILDKIGQKWFFENVLSGDRKLIFREIEKSYSEIEFDFARKFVKKTYEKLIKKYK